MRIAVLFFASTALAGAVALGGCADWRSTGRSTTAAPASTAPRTTAPASADLRESQQQLKSLGYYDGAVDGLWGPETQAAVERYQRERGLSATGRIDSPTRASLRETTAGRAGTTAATARDPQAPVTLTNEADIRTVQNRLAQLDFYQGEPSGVWNSETQTAMEDFQRARGLPAGTLNQATLNAMGLDAVTTASSGRDGTFTSQATPEADIAPAAGPAARTMSPQGLSRADVRSVQQKLADEGLYNGSIDGIWGPRSERALINFQTQNGLRADGRIDPRTANALGLNL